MRCQLGDQQNDDPFKLLRNLKINNLNRLIIGHININSIRNKFDALKEMVKDNMDILVITETKLDESFPTLQFAIDGFALPFRYDRIHAGGGGVLLYVREDIPCKQLPGDNIEGIFIEINLRRNKWLLFGGYNNHKLNIQNFLGKLGSNIDRYMSKLEHFLFLGDFNSEVHEEGMRTFCEMYNLRNLIVGPTCFKNPLHPSSIDVILTNRARSFQNICIMESGLSDHHKMTICVMKQHVPKQAARQVIYRDYKRFNNLLFRDDLLEGIKNMSDEKNYEEFDTEFMNHLNKHAPMKKKYVRANNSPFMNKNLCKAFMNRSRLKNKFINNPNNMNKSNYKRQRNYCVNLLRREKKKFYGNLDIKNFTDNKQFWKTVKPFFSEKSKSTKKITLIEGDSIISKDDVIATTFNNLFSNAVKVLEIKGYDTDNFSYDKSLGDIHNAIIKFENHPSITKIKEMIDVNVRFKFLESNEEGIMDIISNLNINKPTTFNNIPAKIIVANKDMLSPTLAKIFNESILSGKFPDLLKLADITPVHKKDDKSTKENYRPVSILPSISKVFEKKIYAQIENFMNKHLSQYLCGFRPGYSTQYCLINMLEKWKNALDKRNFAGALLTDLSKAFDCLNHELLIAKLYAYGFDYSSLELIFSYLQGRMQRTKVNNSFSSWASLNTGIPQGSVLGPLLFNIYLNDIFYFVNENCLTNYADDNTPYTIENTIEIVIENLQDCTNTLVNWFNDNYFKINIDKCHLLVANMVGNVSANINGDTIFGKKSVNLLGVTIDNELNFNEHVTKLCKKASLKLHALARISHLMNKNKLRNLMKAFIESQFGYCPLVWMFHSRTLNNRINSLHERALRLVYNDQKLSFQELLDMDKSFSIHDRNLQKLAIEMYKIKNSLSPGFMNSIFPQSKNPYMLRNESLFQTNNVRTVHYGTETLTFRGPKTWALIPQDIRNATNLDEFKAKIKHWRPKGCTCRICKIFIADLGFI